MEWAWMEDGVRCPEKELGGELDCLMGSVQKQKLGEEGVGWGKRQARYLRGHSLPVVQSPQKCRPCVSLTESRPK